MKKLLSCLSLLLIILISGCKLQSINKNNIVNLSLNMNDCDTNYGKLAVLTINKTLELRNYLIQNELIDNARMATSDEGLASIGIDNLEENLSDDNIIFIDDLLADYNFQMESLIPDYSECISSGLLEIDKENKVIIVSDDEVIPLCSVEGILTVEIANMMVKGKTEDEAISSIQNDIDKLISGSEQFRSLYIKPEYSGWGTKWENGTVLYHFETGEKELSEAYKLEMKLAMEDWHDLVMFANDNKELIRFEEVSPNIWEKICAGFFQYNYLKIQKKDLEFADGESMVGSFSHGISVLNIDENGIENYKNYRARIDSKTGSPYDLYDRKFTRVPRHELGHALGLMHEHQRSDRDYYIEIDSTDDNYSIIKDNKFYCAVKVVKVCGIKIYIPYVWVGSYGVRVGDFDFDSIMLYSGIPLAPGVKEELNYFSNYTNLNYLISDTDIKSIIQLYGEN